MDRIPFSSTGKILILLLKGCQVGAGPVLHRLDGEKNAELVKIPVSSTGRILSLLLVCNKY